MERAETAEALREMQRSEPDIVVLIVLDEKSMETEDFDNMVEGLLGVHVELPPYDFWSDLLPWRLSSPTYFHVCCV